MTDMDDEKLKKEIDGIMENVDNIMKKLENLNLIKKEKFTEIKNEE